MKKLVIIIFFIKTISGLSQSTNFGSLEVISDLVDNVQSICMSFIDNDTFPEVLSASYTDGIIAYYPNDGNGNFGSQMIICDTISSAKKIIACDLTGNDKNDVIVISNGTPNYVLWFEISSSGSINNEPNIISSDLQSVYGVYACDLDGDNDNDIITASYDDDKLGWYENDGFGNFSTQKIISVLVEDVSKVYACDIDGDNDNDIFSYSSVGTKLSWYENDGDGNFGSQKTFSTDGGVMSILSSDVDGDNDLDIVANSNNFTDRISWFENVDGQGDTLTRHVISTDINEPYVAFPVDLDRDGDIDVISGSRMDGKLAWYENIDGLGNFGSQNLLASGMFSYITVDAADVNGDLDVDIIAGTGTGDQIHLFENLLPPKFYLQPDSLEVCYEDTVMLVAGAFATEYYAWYRWDGNSFSSIFEGSLYKGVNNDTLYINGVYNMEERFRCTAMNNDDYTYSDTALIIIHNRPMDISFTVSSPIETGETSTIVYEGDISSNDTFLWDFAEATTSPIGIGPHNISWDEFGFKKIILSVINEYNCKSDTTSRNIIVKPSALFSLSDTVCSNKNQTINYIGSASISGNFTWDFADGTINSGSGIGPFDITWISPGEKIISLQVEEDGFNSSINVDTIQVFPSVLVNLGEDTYFCNNDSIQLKATVSGGTPGFIYDWYGTSGDSISEKIAPVSASEYSIKVTDEIGCANTDTIIVQPVFPYMSQSICMVTVDSLINQNNIIWEKPQRNDIRQFNVYRHSTGAYILIGALDYSEIPIFVDTASNPRVQSYEYSVTVLDTCLNESDYSDFHKTIHLGSSVGSEPGSIELSWNDYLDNSGSFVPTEYHIYRGETIDNLNYLTTVTNSAFTHESYTDINAGDNRYYRILVDFPAPCDPAGLLKGSNGPFSRSLSNLEDNRQQGSGVEDNAANLSLNIYPNPARDNAVIVLPKSDISYTLNVYDQLGRRISKETNVSGNEYMYDCGDLPAGIYIVELKGYVVSRGRLIME